MNYIDKKLKEMETHLGKKGTKLYNERKKRWTKQIIKNGWADYETWSLDSYLAPYILERLKVFKKKTNGFPYGLTKKSWYENIDKMILAFELIKTKAWDLSEKDVKIVKNGLSLFSEYYLSLWW